MKFNETGIFVFIAAVALGILVSLNINFNRQPEKWVLSAQQYQDAYNSRQKLYKDIANLESQYTANYLKLQKYKNGDVSSSRILKDISQELEDSRLILGSSDVVGEGLIITLEDGDLIFDGTPESQVKNWEKIVHDRDIRLTIKNLRNAGAKAISINGMRVINTSSFVCADKFVLVDGVKHAAPFHIAAIGNKDVLSNYMMSGEGHLKFISYFREVKVSVITEDEIKIPAYIGELQYKYMTETIN